MQHTIDQGLLLDVYTDLSLLFGVLKIRLAGGNREILNVFIFGKSIER